MEPNEIIPTRHRSKIPHTLSYPIGAKAISEAIAGVPQFSELRIEFCYWNHVGGRPGVDRNTYRVIEAHFWASMRGPSNSLDGWTISVDAVPRLLRHEIQTKILAEALPSIKSWLVAHPHSAGGHRITFTFDELRNELLSEEYALSVQTERA